MWIILYGRLHDEKKYFIILKDATIIKFDKIDDIRELIIDLTKIINVLEKMEKKEKEK